MNQSTAGQTRRTRCLGVAVALVAAVLALCGLQPRATAAQEPPPPPQVASQAPANDTLIAVEGEVLDAVSGVPVAAAIVVLAGGPTTFSDRMGYFRFEAVPPGTYSLRVFRVGYATVEARTPIDGQEVLVIRMDPGPIPLEGIEVRVRGRDELERRAAGSPVGIIGPVEMERLSQRYLTMDQVLAGRFMAGARFRPSRGFGDPGCLVVSGSRAGSCVAVVVDGVLLPPSDASWVYEISPSDVFAVRFLRGSEAGLRYGYSGAPGVLVVESRMGRR